MFSTFSVLAYGGPEVEPIVENGEEIGFALVQDFRQLGWPMPCHYRYEQRYELYRDGRFRVPKDEHRPCYRSWRSRWIRCPACRRRPMDPC